jgi:hypothetical protein
MSPFLPKLEDFTELNPAALAERAASADPAARQDLLGIVAMVGLRVPLLRLPYRRCP